MKHLTSVVINSATYLLTISSPDINNVAMRLYNIMETLCPTQTRSTGYRTQLYQKHILIPVNMVMGVCSDSGSNT